MGIQGLETGVRTRDTEIGDRDSAFGIGVLTDLVVAPCNIEQ